MENPDYFELAQVTTREQFMAHCPWPFFVGAGVLKRPTGPSQTIVHLETEEVRGAIRSTPATEAPKPLVLAVRKIQPVFPSRISVGRTGNNDVVVPDVQVSKVHAYIKNSDGTLEISDAGSRNGTWVGSDRLVAKGPPRVLLSGERVRFGTLEFLFFSNDVAWTRLRAWKK